MRKITAFIVAALMAFSLFACAGKTTPGASPGGETSAPASASGTETSAAPSADQSPSASGSPEAAGPVGFITDKADHFDREPYKVEFIYGVTCGQTANFTDALTKLSKKMNFTLTSFSSEMDIDKYMNEIQTQINLGVDGFVFSPPFEALQRQDELCKEANIPYVNSLNAYTDENGYTLSPTVTFDGYLAGANLTKWLVENYKNYFKDAELKDIGYIIIDFSVSAEFSTRANGAKDEYLKLYPELEKNIYHVDLVDLGFSIDSGYTKTAATLAAHADVPYWFIFGVSEDFVVGAARAVEAAAKTDTTILISTGSDICFDAWTAPDNTPGWVATVPIYKTDFCVPLAAGLVALMDGRATPETLWEGVLKDGDKAAQYLVPVSVVTRDNFKDFIVQSDAVMDLLK